MSDWNGGSRSPSPDAQACVPSCRSSRAESEVPSHRLCDAIAGAPRSRHSTRCSSLADIDTLVAAGTRRPEGHSLRSSPGRFADVDDPLSDRKAKASAVAGAAKTDGNASTILRGVARAMVSNETRKTLYQSIPHASGAFQLLRQIHYPCDSPDASLRDRGSSQSPEVDGESAEYEATGEMHLGSGAECGSSRSVVRQEMETVKSAVSSLALGMLPDPVHDRPALAIVIGDANGRVNYYEIGVGPQMQNTCSTLSVSPPTMSSASAASRSQMDMDLATYSTSLEPSHSPTSDVMRFQRPPVRHHSHQAYVHEMDCLTSVTILQSVRTLRFFRNHESPSTVSYLTSNERVIKLFRVSRDGFSPFHAFPAMESVVGKHLAHTRYFPRSAPPSLILPVRVFAGCHSNLIQDLSICADEQTFLSVDDLQVFWWNLECAVESKGVCIADYRPESGRMDDVEELISAASFHPSHSSLFIVSRSSGVIGVGDLRDPPSRRERQFVTSMSVSKDRFCNEQYSDILGSVSDAKFLGPNYVVSRDYLSLKLWDLRNPSICCSSVPVMEYVSPYLDKLYENDCIFDRFPLDVDHVSGTVLTGLYDRAVSVWQPLSEGNIDATDNLAYYRADSQSLLHEVEDVGRTTKEDLCKSIVRAWGAQVVGNYSSDNMSREVPEAFLNKVLTLSVADGGERFAFTSSDGRCISLFERGTTSGGDCHITANEEEMK